jgi:hypothetical protein
MDWFSTNNTTKFDNGAHAGEMVMVEETLIARYPCQTI